MTILCKQARFLFCGLALLAPWTFGQSAQQTPPPEQQPPLQQPASQQPPPVPAATRANVPVTEAAPLPPRFSAGFRVEYFPGRLFSTQVAASSSTNPILSDAYFGTAVGSKLTFGVTAEYRLTKHISVVGDFYYHQVEFVQLTQIKSGLPDPNSSYDNRPLTSINEDTRAEYLEVPIVARYYAPGGKHLKVLSQTYVFGGMAYRHVGDIRTGTSTSDPDGTTSYNEVPATPVKANIIGAVGGAGYKLFEYGKFKSLIEARYTRWFGYSFQGPSYASQKNQVEYGLSITY